MSDKSKKKEGGPPQIEITDDLDFEEVRDNENDALLGKKKSQANNYGSVDPLNFQSTAESQNLKNTFVGGTFTPKVTNKGFINPNHNISMTRMSISSTSSKNFKHKISQRAPFMGLKASSPKGSIGRNRKLSNASNFLIPRTTTVIEKGNSSENQSQSTPIEQDAKSDISLSQLDSERWRMLICILVAFFAIHSTNMNVETIIPTHVGHKHKQLTELNVSFIIMQKNYDLIIFSAFEIGGLIFSPIAGVLLQPIGRKNSVIMGFIILILAQFGVGTTESINDDWWFLYMNIAYRFVEGMGDAFVQTACYSLISLKYPENREKFIGLGEAFSGVGLMAGPGIAGILYTYFGYFTAFFCFVIFIGLSGIFCQIFIPQSMNGTYSEDDENKDNEQDQAEGQEGVIQDGKFCGKVDYKMFLMDRRTLFGVITCTYCCFLFQFASSFFVTALEYEKHVPIQYNGVIASYGSLTYLLTTVLTGYISHVMPKRLFILLSFVSITIGLFLMGPSDILGLPNKIWLFLVGYGLVGAAQGFLFIPILPEIIESFCDRYGIVEGEDEQVDEDISDRASGLYGAFYYSGMIISPITGSIIYHNLKSFNKTCDLFAMFSIAYIIIYYFFNILPDRKTLWQHNQPKNESKKL